METIAQSYSTSVETSEQQGLSIEEEFMLAKSTFVAKGHLFYGSNNKWNAFLLLTEGLDGLSFIIHLKPSRRIANLPKTWK
jgi:hypothetical protein